MIQTAKEPIQNFWAWKSYRERTDAESFEYLVRQYLPLVEQMASKISAGLPKNILPREDLVGMGYIGLVEAIQKFDYQKGYQFETYGLWRIKGAMLDGLRQLDWVPRSLREKAKRVNTGYRDLEQKLMRLPTEAEVSDHLEISQDEVKQSTAVLTLSTLLSLNEPVKGEGEGGKQHSRIDMIPDDSNLQQSQHVQLEELKRMVADCIDRMPEKERLVITLLYYEELSQVEIAEVLGLTKGRISQLHSQAILRFRRYFEDNGYSLGEFY